MSLQKFNFFDDNHRHTKLQQQQQQKAKANCRIAALINQR